jgi:hypothetical protein
MNWVGGLDLSRHEHELLPAFAPEINSIQSKQEGNFAHPLRRWNIGNRNPKEIVTINSTEKGVVYP